MVTLARRKIGLEAVHLGTECCSPRIFLSSGLDRPRHSRFPKISIKITKSLSNTERMHGGDGSAEDSTCMSICGSTDIDCIKNRLDRSESDKCSVALNVQVLYLAQQRHAYLLFSMFVAS